MLINVFIFLGYLFLLVLPAPHKGPAKPYGSGDHYPWGEEKIVLNNDACQIFISGNSSNGHPEIQIIKKGAFEVKRILNPELTVFYYDSDPGYLFKEKGIEGSSPVACWGESEEADLWKVGTPSLMMAKEFEKINQSVRFNFEKAEDFEIQLQLDLPEGEGIPDFSWKITSFVNDYSTNWQEFDMTTKIQEQVIPAWHTSLVGLLPEQPGTDVYGPIMLFHQVGALLSMAHLKDDPILRDVAYNAVLGRYNNFPGYNFNSFETNVYQQTDYPLHSYLEINYNAVFYNHIWDEQYPYEFSFRLADPTATIEWKWEAIEPGGEKVVSEVFQLQ